ncbi:hypothetical protein [Actinomadura verrucosospora]|uniref:Putative secreted protein n=1 Tax=Actinomadura verrucosospora TaxID=46165 RepID=A0A7D4AAR4_ACTVE|nr:hypothetical protein [Actinomadura verrucosospora]QKG25707.1 putative secreted protein [Actinomadura verrucosospora]
MIVALACAGTLTACGDASGVAKPPHTLEPGGSTATPAKDSPHGEHLVLRMRKRGGMAGLGGPGALPDFSLYSTGRAVTASQGKPTEYRLKPAAVNRLLADARAAGLGRSHTVGPGNVSDAFILEFTMGGAHSSIAQPGSRPDPAPAFQKRLDPSTWATSDVASGPAPFKPSKVAVLASQGAVADGPVKTWPLAPLGQGARVGAAVCTVASPAKVPATSPNTAWRSGGATYTVRVRPLLPDEHSCADLR